jgi:hypothetical protein
LLDCERCRGDSRSRAGQLLPGICPFSGSMLPQRLRPAHRPYRLVSDAADVYRLRRFGTVRAIHIGDVMLRITIHDDGKVCRLELAGRLEGPWVAETENAWRLSLGPDRKIEVDLRQLTGVDNAGRDLLATIHQSGACLIVEGIWLTTLLGDLTSQTCDDAMVQSSSKKLPRRPTSRQQESNK